MTYEFIETLTCQNCEKELAVKDYKCVVYLNYGDYVKGSLRFHLLTS